VCEVDNDDENEFDILDIPLVKRYEMGITLIVSPCESGEKCRRGNGMIVKD